jgi:hypothetical protein
MRGTTASAGAAPSPASVVIPAVPSRAIWSRRMPATRTRWSRSSHQASQRSRKSQISQCAHDVEPPGQAARDPPDLLGVEAQLQHVRRLPAPGELRVDDLVAAVRLPLDEVRQPAPLPVHERGLVDDPGAGGERSLGLAGRPLPVPVALVAERDLDDVAPRVAQPLEVTRLVLVPEPLDEIPLRIRDLGPRQLAARDPKLELRQVRAGDPGRQVGRGERDGSVREAHRDILSAPRRPPPRPDGERSRAAT